MKATWKRLLSLLLTAAMVLSLGATGYAADGDEDIVLADPDTETAAGQQTGSAADGTELEMEDLDPAKLGIHKLGEDTQEDEISVFDTEEAFAGAEINPDENVRVSIFLDEAAALDLGYPMRGVGANSAAIAYRSSLRARQDALTAQIESTTGHMLDVRWNMTLATNAISAMVPARDIPVISELPGVRAVVRENYYLPPVDEPAEPNTANTSENMVGAQAAWEAGYSGAGSRIAIIDTGIDTTHQSFAAEPFTYSISQLGATGELMTRAQVQALASQLNSKSGNYVSAKIPYGYNYVDGNTTINHTGDTQGEHGSHVAGIAAANRYIGSAHSDAADTVGAVGMAPDAQLFIMKVFGSKGGAYDSDYMVAIEDAIVLDCDVVNLSLGSGSQGWTFDDTYQDILNNLANAAHNEGMVVSISAGNSYDFAKLTSAGNLYKDDVYYHTGGSPGSFVNSLCVAAAQNTLTEGTPMIFNGSQKVFYAESTEDSDGNAYTNPALTTVKGTYNYVYIDAVGETSDYSAVNSAVSLSGKVVIVNRGSNSFYEKGNNAISYSPKALVVANNADGVIHMALDDYTGTFPMVSITLKDANLIKGSSAPHTANGITYYTGSVEITTTTQSEITERSEATITDFSSWGVPGSLIMKPEITAPGGDIYSVAGTHKTSSGTAGGSDQYELMSGTSMAAPHITGLSAVVAEYLRENPVSERNSELSGAYSTRAIIQSLLMSTATPMRPGGEYLSVLQQGAGLAEVSKAVSSPSVLMMNDEGKTLTMRTGANADGKVKAEFGDDPEREGMYGFGFTLYNLSDEDLSFTLDTDLFTQKISGEFLARGTDDLPKGGVTYLWNGAAEEPSAEHDVNKDGRTDEEDAQAILDYFAEKYDEEDLDLEAADMDGDGEVTTYDAHLLLNWEPEGGTANGDYVLAAHGTATVFVDINLTNAQRKFLDEHYPNGAYLEGFTYVTCTDATREGVSLAHEHTIPLLGFYGSWTGPSMFDNMSYVDGLYGAEREPYSGTADTNYLMVSFGGSNTKFSGNPYTVEDEFPAERLALNSNTNLVRISYNQIRAAGTTGFAVTRLDDEGKVESVLSSSVTGNKVLGMYYSSTAGWQNTSTKIYSINKSVGSYNLTEGDRFRVGYYAVPEYYGMLVNDSYDESGSGTLTLGGFNELLTENILGRGAMVGYDFVVDNTDPVISTASLNGNTLSVSASDNENLAYVAVLSLDGTVKYAEAAPGDKTYTISFDASDAITNAHGYVAVFAGDYAGNEVAKAVKVNDNTYEEKTVYVLSGSMTAGNDYLIVNRNSAGSGVALGHSGTTVATNDVAVKAGISDTGNQPYIESVGVAGTSVWTAAGGITLKNGSYYLGYSGTFSYSLAISTTSRNWTYSNNRLSVSAGSRTYYLRYNNGFSINTSQNNIYVYQKTVIRTEVDPYHATGISVLPNSLDLYKGGSGDLSAKVIPLTATDRSVTWSSSNASVATVDQTGHVTAVAAGTATITATSNGNSALSASCTVTVTAVDKTLHSIIWDEKGGVYFSSFNAGSLPTWTKLHSSSADLQLHSAFMQSSSTLYAGTLDGSDLSTTLYTVNRSSYALTEVGENFVGAMDIAPGVTSSTYTSRAGMVYCFGPYLIAGNYASSTVQLDDDGSTFTGTGIPYGLLDVSDTIGAYLVGVAAKSVGSSSSSYYLLDENGMIWTTTLSCGLLSGVSFSEPTKVMETGISTSFVYQSLYYDGTWLYWGHQTDDLAELIIINPSTQKVFRAGNFGDSVWPVVGLYTNGSVAPSSVDDGDEPMELDLQPAATRDELLTEEVCRRMGLAFSGETAENDLELVDMDENEPDLILEEPENDEIVIEPDGTLTAIRGSAAVTSTESGSETDETGRVVVTVTEDSACTNGWITVDFDAEALTLNEEETTSALRYHSFLFDDKGLVTLFYASKEALPAGTVLAEIVFSTACEDTEVTVQTWERNDDFELDEAEDVVIAGTGHDWSGPVWRWAVDYTRATASFICLNNGDHIRNAEAEIAVETVAPGCETEGTTTYTASAVFEGETYTDQKIVTSPATGHSPGEAVKENETAAGCETEGGYDMVVYCTACGEELSREHTTLPALGHDWGEPSYEWAADNSTVTATRTCKRDSSHVETETANASYAVITAPTTTSEGLGRYTASFTNPAFETQTKDVVLDRLPSVGFTISIDDKKTGAAISFVDPETGEAAVLADQTLVVPDAEGKFSFTVSSAKDQAVLVAVKNTGDGDEAYQVVKCVTDTTSGVHSFTITLAADSTIVLAFRGDVNLDGRVRATDGTEIKKHVAGITTITGVVNLLAADTNGDGRIRATDGTQVARSLVGTDTIAW